MNEPNRALLAGVFLLSLFGSACASPVPPVGGLVAATTIASAADSAGASPVAARTASPLPLATPTPMPEADAAETPPSGPGVTAVVPCDDRAGFIGDVTIRDNSVMPAGESFVKIWRLQNAGTCDWTREYSLVFLGGERMGAPASLPLATVVPQGATIDLALDLVAPLEPGTYQGFWRLSNPEGLLFGIGPNGAESFWVKIVVEAPAAIATSTPSPTARPLVYAMGTFQLAPGDGADLDTGALQPQEGVDLVLRAAALGALELAPRSGALLSAGNSQGISDPATCLTTSLSTEAVPLTALAPGVSLCYRTDEGRPGLLVVNSLNENLDFSYTTWTP